MIHVFASDLPFLRFVRRHQLAIRSLRYLSEHGAINALERGDAQAIAVEINTTARDLKELEQLSAWWDKAEHQGISTRLVGRLKPKADSGANFVA